jgi:hypothetical protein
MKEIMRLLLKSSDEKGQGVGCKHLPTWSGSCPRIKDKALSKLPRWTSTLGCLEALDQGLENQILSKLGYL